MNHWIYEDKERLIGEYSEDFAECDWYIVGDTSLYSTEENSNILHVVNGSYCCRNTPAEDNCWSCKVPIPDEIKTIAMIMESV